MRKLKFFTIRVKYDDDYLPPMSYNNLQEAVIKCNKLIYAGHEVKFKEFEYLEV